MTAGTGYLSGGIQSAPPTRPSVIYDSPFGRCTLRRKSMNWRFTWSNRFRSSGRNQRIGGSSSKASASASARRGRSAAVALRTVGDPEPTGAVSGRRFTRSGLDSEPVEQPFVSPPALPDLHGEVQIDALADPVLDLRAGGGSDLPD